MAQGGPLEETVHGPSDRLLKAGILSAALHLVLLMLIQPARWEGPAETVLHARLVPMVAQVDSQTALLPGNDGQMAATSAVALEELPTHDNRKAMPTPQPADLRPPGVPEAAGPQVSTEASTPQPAALPPAEAPEVLPEIPVMLDTHWYTAREVERRPEPLDPIEPVYPEEARLRGIAGSVVIALHIDEDGEVRKLEILESHPPGVFDAAVIAAYTKVRFQPAARGGRTVRYIGKYRVLFELD